MATEVNARLEVGNPRSTRELLHPIRFLLPYLAVWALACSGGLSRTEAAKLLRDSSNFRHAEESLKLNWCNGPAMVVTNLAVTGVSTDDRTGLIEFTYTLEPAPTTAMTESDKQCASMYVDTQAIIDKHKGHTRRRRATIRRFDDGWRVEQVGDLGDNLESLTR